MSRRSQNNHHPPKRAVRFSLDGLSNHFVCLFTGGLKEAARVDNHDFRVGLARDDAARLGQLPEHLLGIDEVLGAAKRYEGNAG